MISVCIAAYKEPNITNCLKAVIAERIPKLEVIVACPDDETALLVKKFKVVKLIKESKREGKPAAINKLLAKAKGSIIFFTDADMVITKGSIKQMIAYFKKPRTGVVIARPFVDKLKGMMGFWGEVLYDLAHKRRLSGAKHVTTNLCAVRRGIVTKIPVQSLVDDYVIGMECLRKGYEIVYEPKAKVKAKFPLNLSDFLKQRRRTFAGYMQVKDWYGESERSLTSEVRSAKSIFSYPKGIKQWLWLLSLVGFRLVAWVLAFWDYRIKKKDLKTIWKPVTSTK